MESSDFTFNGKDLPQMTFTLLTSILIECQITNELLIGQMSAGDNEKEDKMFERLKEDRKALMVDLMKILYPDYGTLPPL